MEMQLKFVSKEMARKIIDEIPGNGVYIMIYNGAIGISDCGKYVKKKKGMRMVDKSSTIVLQQNNFISKLNLHKNLFNDFSDYNKEDIIKSILIPQLE